MPAVESWFGFLKRPASLVASILLAAQSVAYYGLPKERPVNLSQPLAAIPKEFGSWRMVREIPLEARVLEVLKADDTVERIYADADGRRWINFYMAFFKSQTTGVSPHSPKNCLPGAGWVASRADSISFSAPGFAQPISVNRYVVSKGDARSLVLYWYQSYNRTVPNEYWAKIWLVLNAIRHRRSDTSIMRVTAPIAGDDEREAEEACVRFIQASLKPINDMLPR
jgi:EpsI family protein